MIFFFWNDESEWFIRVFFDISDAPGDFYNGKRKKTEAATATATPQPSDEL